jgi:5-methylcytosine-specific restriction enzyme A
MSNRGYQMSKKPIDNKRSAQWPKLRKGFLKGKVCAACGGKKKLEAHHIKPFHLHPDLELDPSNLVALCEGNKDVNCHLVIGHSFDFKGFNSEAVVDAASIARKKSECESFVKSQKKCPA